MDSERWQQIEALFEKAQELAPAEREKLLAESAVRDPDVVAEVRRLLASEVDAVDASFMASPAVDLPLSELMPEQPLASELVGQMLGPYRLTDVIGSGGMGTVYIAERADAEYEKRVAVKLIKRGMDTEEILRRFRLERQVLANLDHPNVQVLLDGGTTEDGLPYLVTEYIEGQPIDVYCDARRLSITERLKLFRIVCDAVQHAHQKLVVHRDLKPSNILVTPAGVPKLLDFGIAKILAPDAAETGATTLSRRPLTPDYASPEQVLGGPITTASDIYSLGVVLYRLLTGHGPYRVTTPSASEIERLVCKFEPTRPSTAVARESPHVTPEQVSRERSTRPDRLARRLRGDLDTMVAMALSKEPERRYASAAQLSEDIDHHIQGLPLRARRPTLRYRAAKFVKRNRPAMLAASLVILSLAAGLAGVVRESRRARSEATTSRQVLSYIDEVLQQFPARGMSNLDAVGDLLSRGVDQATSRLADQPQAQARVLETIAGVYESYDLLPDAIHTRRRILDLRRRTFGDVHPSVADGMRDLAAVLLQTGRGEEAERLLSEAIELRGNTGSAEDIVARHLLGMALWEQGSLEKAGELLEAALLSWNPAPAPAPRELIEQWIDVGRFRTAIGEYENAERILREALAATQHEGAEDPVQAVRAMRHLARTLYETEQLAASDAMLQSAVGSAKSVVGYYHPVVAELLRDLAVVRGQRKSRLGLLHAHDLLGRQAATIHARLLGKLHREVGRSQLSFATTARDPIEREVMARRAMRTMQEVLPEGHVELSDPMLGLGRLLVLADRPAEGEPLLREALTIRRERMPASHWTIAETLEGLGLALIALGRPDEAQQRLLEARTSLDGRGLSIRLTDLRVLGDLFMLYTATGDREQAGVYEALLRERRIPTILRPQIPPSRLQNNFEMDYDDDCAEKTIPVNNADLVRASGATLWIYGKPYNWAGASFEDREDHIILVNRDPQQERSFDVALAFHENTETFTWAPFEIPVDWLIAGDNRFSIIERSPEGTWDHNNLWIGVDESHDLDRSWVCRNDRPCCYMPDERKGKESRFSGELMIFVELRGVPIQSDEKSHPNVDPELADRMIPVGESLLAGNSVESARRVFEAALGLFSNLDDPVGPAAAKSGIGGCLVATGNFAEAERYLINSYDRFPNFSLFKRRITLERLIAAYEGLGRRERATYFRQMLEELPLPLPLQQPDPHKLGDAGAGA